MSSSLIHVPASDTTAITPSIDDNITDILITTMESVTALSREMPARRRRANEAALVFLKAHRAEMKASEQADDPRDFDMYIRQLSSILVPRWPLWAIPLGCVIHLLSIVIIIPFAMKHFYPSTSKLAIFNASAVLTCFGLRIYFTFRSRVLTRLGISLTDGRAFVDLRARHSADFFAMGSNEYRTAPLPGAWQGLTSRERMQSGRQRTLVLVLVIIVSLLVDLGVPIATFLLGYAAACHFHGDTLISHIAAVCVSIPFGLALLQGMSIIQLSLARLRRLGDRHGYGWAGQNDISRSFIDQMLATYHVHNPTRDEERQLDALLAAESVPED